MFDRLSVDVEDAATAFAQSVRLMLRLCRSRPQISAALVWEGMHYTESEGGVGAAPAARHPGGRGIGPVPQGRAAVGPSRRLRCGAGHAADVAACRTSGLEAGLRCRAGRRIGQTKDRRSPSHRTTIDEQPGHGPLARILSAELGRCQVGQFVGSSSRDSGPCSTNGRRSP